MLIIIQGRIYVGAGGHVPPDSLVAPQIQKLSDCSDVIFEVPKCSKMQIFWGSAPDPAEGAYSVPPDPLADGKGARCSPSKNPTPALGPSGLVSIQVSGSNPLQTTELATIMIDFNCV